MERPVKKILLPITQKEVEIITYFTRGEKQEIQKTLMAGAKMIGNEPQIDLSATFESKNKALEIAVKNMPLSEINDLPEEDGDFLEKEVDTISQPKKK
jgi:hypothetical protein